MHIQEWLETVPAVSIYLLVGLVIGLESLGIPLPGEIVLVSAALLAGTQDHIDPVILGASATVGAIVGDSIGYLIGRKGGQPLLNWLGGKFPKHFGPRQVASAERSFQKWGMWAVFFGRFVALLRIFAGPLAGVLRMPYWKFAIANVLGGIVWAGGTTAVIYYLGVVAEDWLKRFSWLGLVIALAIGLVSMLVMKRKARHEAQSAEPEPEPAAEAPAEPAADAPAADAGPTEATVDGAAGAEPDAGRDGAGERTDPALGAEPAAV
ncbi:DedA family protein [Streptomyces zagrosensis]|uniref:Membrane protein DedA with SNARE-associated domain n=1 Tax=Streptomyces zagrosensis TaxID=1042984 RepID=A0A7W9QDG2_9ACTN|nr:DedA family protein [Streptomyces zagrosensis]MBB5937182.1 membrane protein DedA with SNARE-associated domain [Streptomyces zagrosensis]